MRRTFPRSYHKKHKLKLVNKKNIVTFNESYLYAGQIIDNFYSHTKFEAETYILNAISNGLDAYILRMGNLMPRFKDGVFQENILDNDFINKIISFMNIKIIPKYLLSYKIELTPVDFAATSIYEVITHPTNINRIFHLYNHNSIPVSKLVKILKNTNHDVDVLTENEFKHKIDLMLHDKNSKYLLKTLIKDFDKNLHLKYKTNLKIESNFTKRYLKKTHFKWPKITNKYLEKLINLLRTVI